MDKKMLAEEIIRRLKEEYPDAFKIRLEAARFFVNKKMT